MELSDTIQFSNATLPKLEALFNLKRNFEANLSSLIEWQKLASEQEVSEVDIQILIRLQQKLKIGGSGWNEVELESKFIAPLFTFADYDDGKIGYFMERFLEAKIGEKKLLGTVDGIISQGYLEPSLPYFCMQEFKRSQDNKGRADGQTLAAMLAAQALNENNFPIYGLYIVGVSWNFMVLEGNDYTISETYTADGKGIYDIFKMLKALKIIISEEIKTLEG